MLNSDDALKIIRESVSPLGTITLAIQHSLGYVLGSDIIARESVPPFDNSSMDGFALCVEDVREVPAIFSVVGEIAAGADPARSVGRGEALRIMTGAKIPDGCTGVVQTEWTEMIGESQVRVLRAVTDGQNIRKAGGDIRSGTCVLQCGRMIRPQEIGTLASLGERFVNVYRQPVVAILATGNEIVDMRDRVTEGKIRNSNAYVLAALVERDGCEAVTLGVARDERAEMRQKILTGLHSDVLITSGGVSAGKYDLVIDVFRDVGVEVKFWKVNIKPGMPMVFGMFGAKPVFGLPGNPVSSMVTFLEFVRPALSIMKGEVNAHQNLRLRARLEEEIRKTDGKRHFVRGVLENSDGSLVVRSTGSQLSNVLTSLSRANCLIILPESKEIFAIGDEVEVELL